MWKSKLYKIQMINGFRWAKKLLPKTKHIKDWSIYTQIHLKVNNWSMAKNDCMEWVAKSNNKSCNTAKSDTSVSDGIMFAFFIFIRCREAMGSSWDKYSYGVELMMMRRVGGLRSNIGVCNDWSILGGLDI